MEFSLLINKGVVQRPCESMKRICVRRQFLRAAEIAATYSILASLGALSSAEMRNETRNVPPLPSTTTADITQPGVADIDPSLFRCWGYEHDSPTPFACCTLWCLRLRTYVYIYVGLFYEKTRAGWFSYILFLSLFLLYFLPIPRNVLYFHIKCDVEFIREIFRVECFFF